MTKQTLKHRLPCGAIATRKTARNYSHVVICREDLTARRAALAIVQQVDARNFDFYRKIAETGVGNCYRHGNGLMSQPVTQADYDKYSALIATHKTAQAFAEHCAAERVAHHDAKHGDAAEGPWYVEGWCGRADLAEKLAAKTRQRTVKDVRIEAINHGA